MACFVFARSRKLSMKSLQKLKISTVPFRLSTAKLCIKLKGGGWEKIMEFAVVNGEQVKLKIFAMQIKFQFGCSRGGETISKQP